MNPNKLPTAKSSVMALLEETTPTAPADANPPAEAEAASPLPTTKAMLLSMDEAGLDTAYDAVPFEIVGWYELNLAAKQTQLSAALFGKKKPKALKPVPADPEAEAQAPAEKPKKAAKAKSAKADLQVDPLAQVAGDIENLTTQEAVETAIADVIAVEGMNDFRLGGLFQKLMEVAQFGENVTFKQYVSDRFGIEYRKARYLIQNYNGLISAGIAWDDVKAIGWTKVSVLIPILTSENVEEWVQKALSVNKETLRELVRAAQAAEAGGEGASPEPVSNMTTKTFTLAADQLELVEMAVEDAKAKGSTDHNGVALEYICNSYLNSDLSASAGVSKMAALQSENSKLKAELASMKAAMADMDAKMASAAVSMSPSPKELFTFALQTYPTKQEALEYVFGPDFDAAFPDVQVDLSLPEVATA